MKENSQKILLSPFFIFSLLLLLLNDFFLKQHFHNFLTGKISDFAGLFVFPLFFAAFFPKYKKAIYILTTIAFVFWKSSFSQSFIASWNSLQILKIDRIIDYTDLAALLILPISFVYFEICAQKQKIISPDFKKQIVTTFIILFSVFAFTATSYEQDRRVSVDKRYVFNGSKDELNLKLRQLKLISNIDERNVKEMFKNAPVANSISPDEYSYSFTINRSVCDGNSIHIFISVESKSNITYLERPALNFWCNQLPTPEMEKEVVEILEREFIAPLQLTLIENSDEIKK